MGLKPLPAKDYAVIVLIFIFRIFQLFALTGNCRMAQIGKQRVVVAINQLFCV